MAVSSIHIASGANGYFAHNSRERQTVNSIFSDEKNFCSCDNKTAFEIYKSELQKRSEAYTKRTGQNLQAKTATHLSAIVNFNQEHTEKDIKKVCDYLEKRFDTKVIQYAMHRDEGHIENGQSIKNYHAHIEFMGIDSEGNSIKRQLKRRELIELQTKVAELLKMERGTNYTAEQKHRPKRLDTYEYKAKAEAVALIKQEDLKAEIAKLRAELKEKGAVRADYAQLEQLNKELQEELKRGTLTIENLDKRLNSHKTHINALELKNEALGKENLALSQKNDLKPFYDEKEINDQAESDILKLQAEHTKRQTTFDKREEKGFLGTKDVYEPKEIIEIKEPKTFFAKVKDLAVKGSTYIQQHLSDLKEEIKRLTGENRYLTQRAQKAESRVEQLERELNEAKAELKTLQNTRVSRYESEMRVNKNLEEYEGWRRKEDGEMANEHKENKAKIAQQESKIAHLEQKLENVVSVDEAMAKTKSALERLQDTINAKPKSPVEELYERLQKDKTKQASYKLNEVPKLPEDNTPPKKPKRDFVRE